MPLRMLPAEDVRALADCPTCGAVMGERCSREKLSARAENHSARVKAARHRAHQRSVERSLARQ